MGELRYGGSTEPSAFAGSMAEAIEHAFNRLLVAEGKTPLPTADGPETRDRRRLFLAIAEGVVKHLHANDDAFDVVFTNVPVPGTFEARIEIDRQDSP